MNCKKVSEGLGKFEVCEGLFYNERMGPCRDLSSLWVGTLPELGILVDGFSASGIRGIRYKLENPNVGVLKFFDRSGRACENIGRNLKLNGVEGEVVCANSNKFFVENSNFDFCEIDPFGSPVPFLDMLFFADYKQKERWISVTATDAAVLCGAHKEACVKNYFSKPLNCEFCHENGLRILLGHIARSAAKNGWELQPQFCISHRHYFKVMARIAKSADMAGKAVEKSKFYVQFCDNCLYRELGGGFPAQVCPQCGGKIRWGGPLWGGRLFEKGVVEKMEGLLAQREYLDAKGLAKFLGRAKEEADAPALYYDLHEICSKFKCKPMQIDETVMRLKAAGHFACRTTFRDTAVRTSASAMEIAEIMRLGSKA